MQFCSIVFRPDEFMWQREDTEVYGRDGTAGVAVLPSNNLLVPYTNNRISGFLS